MFSPLMAMEGLYMHGVSFALQQIICFATFQLYAVGVTSMSMRGFYKWPTHWVPNMIFIFLLHPSLCGFVKNFNPPQRIIHGIQVNPSPDGRVPILFSLINFQILHFDFDDFHHIFMEEF